MARKGRKVQQTNPLKTWGIPLAITVVLGAFVLFLVTQGGGSGETGDITGESQEYYPVSGFQDIHGMALNPEDPSELYVATHHGLIRGVDDGNWARVGDVEDDLMGFSMHPTDGDTFWVSGHPKTGGNMGVRQSSDGGFTWETLWAESVDFHAMAVSPANPDNLWGFFAGKLYRSTDGGHDWSVVNDAPPRMMGLVGDRDDVETLYAGTLGSVVRSTDGGKNWETFANVPAIGLAIAASDSDVMYAAGEEGVYKSTDGGETWSEPISGFAGGVVGYLAIHPEDPQTVYAGTFQSGVYKSTDGGETWSTVKTPMR